MNILLFCVVKNPSYPRLGSDQSWKCAKTHPTAFQESNLRGNTILFGDILALNMTC